MPLKSSLFHQKLELIQIAFLNTCGLVYIAQQLISPPRLLPPMPTGPSSTLPLKNQFLNLPISSFSIKSRQRSPLPPIFSLGSYEYVYQLIRSLVFQMPTIIVSLILPSAINVFVVFCTSQATPKAALLGQKRFWPSWRRSKGYFLYGLSLQDGGQQRLSLRLLFRIVEWIGVVSMILFIVGLKLGYRGMMGASCEPAGSVNTTLAPIIHLVSLTNTFTLTLT